MKSSGYAEFNRQAGESVEKNLLPADSTAVPTPLLLLILVFRSGAAALLPLAVAGVSVVGSPAILVVVAQFTSVSVFATNLTTALGLGLATAHRAAPPGALTVADSGPIPATFRAMVFVLGPGTAPAGSADPQRNRDLRSTPGTRRDPLQPEFSQVGGGLLMWSLGDSNS
ncbi:hypothetical protein SFUL_3530 [Streptomyces microflavus DSM 40593]|uniref:Membrane transport protein MMPL domain-containing protein n=1 Tax=Streptomyces microflavus DSM 40593 TaxID=1303692 RepID=N0CY24_STRMI|nr:MMPL family transporter [Streptomyces microflavus]AGK78458.1 hypothetical protein SFUL_3530 [Streptomyces microflavus DSM 40593]